MIYEARVTGKFGSQYWVQIPTKYGQQDVGPIKATGIVSPEIGEICYVGYLPTADTFVILAGPQGTALVSWADIADKPTTFAPAAHNHSATNITSGTLSSARLPLATSSANGALSAADKAKLDAAAVIATPGTLALRNSAGQIQVADPGSAPDAANRRYVDAQISAVEGSVLIATGADLDTYTTSGRFHQTQNANASTALHYPQTLAGNLRVLDTGAGFVYQWYTAYGTNGRFSYRVRYNNVWSAWDTASIEGHTHAATDITSGTLAAARLPLATSSANGAMSSTDKAKLDAATLNSTANTIAMRDADGKLATQAPTGPTHATNKTYVDDAIAGRAPASHTHAWTEITSKPTTFAPSSHTHAATDITSGTLAAARLPVATQSVHGAMSAADKTKLDGAAYDGGPSTMMMTSSSDYAKAGQFFVSLAQSTLAHALTRKDYVDGLAAGKLDKELIELPDLANLNDYTTTGDYHQSANSRAGNGTNYPVAFAGKLEVRASTSGTFVYQEYTAYNSTGRKFYRCKYSTTWYAWKEIGVRTAPAVWSSVSINTTNFTLYDSASYAQITEDNGLVTLSAVLKPTSAGVAGVLDISGAHALTVPSQYLPASTKSLIWVMQASGREHVTGSLEADGRFTIGRHTATPSTSTWLPIYVQWRL